MASIKFYATEEGAGSPGGTLIDHANGSGLGFYGAGYGVSVPIGSTQDTTWLTNSDGTSSERVQLNNNKKPGNLTQVSVNGAAAIDLDKLPNYLCPLNIRFENDDAVRVQNCKLRIFDRNDISKQASGVSTYVFEARHPKNDQAVTNLKHRGRLTNQWLEFDPVEAMSDMTFTNSPGVSGTNTDNTETLSASVLGYVSQNGSTHAAVRHDWYVALSAEPDSVGSKLNYALFFSCEYL